MDTDTRDSTLAIRELHLAEYRQVLELQRQLQEQRRAGQITDTVLIVEHPPVITLGARKSANKLLVAEDELHRRGVEIVEIRRGGGATAHNPGQLVFYPIMNLQERKLGVSEYVRTLEQIGIDLLGHFNLASERRKGYPGLWVEQRKIASIGVRVSRWITHHGMAININNDLGLFDVMVPCGLDGVTMTSLQRETGTLHDMAEVKARLTALLRDHFGERLS